MKAANQTKLRRAFRLAVSKLRQIAKECSGCDGSGFQQHSYTVRGRPIERRLPCEDCADIREVIDKCRELAQ